MYANRDKCRPVVAHGGEHILAPCGKGKNVTLLGEGEKIYGFRAEI